ncbi:hypothetical protein [Streptomyces sp. NPDC002853]
MAWDEWEKLKAEATERSSAHMRLNGADPGDGGRGLGMPTEAGVLKVSNKDLAAVGSKAHDLYDRLWREARVAVPTSDTAAGELRSQGFALGGALQHVSTRWEEQLKSLLDACAHISNHMRFTRKTHQSDEDTIYRAMSSIETLDKAFDEGKRP